MTVESSLARIVTVTEKTEWNIWASLSVEEPTGQIVDNIECSIVTALFRGSKGPDLSKYCLV